MHLTLFLVTRNGFAFEISFQTSSHGEVMKAICFKRLLSLLKGMMDELFALEILAAVIEMSDVEFTNS